MWQNSTRYFNNLNWFSADTYILLLNIKDNFIYIIAFSSFGHCIMLIIKFNETWYYPIETEVKIWNNRVKFFMTIKERFLL